MARRSRKCSFWYQTVGLSSPSFGIYLKSYHQINVRSVAAKLAEAETVIKGMHSIKRNPITFCIREIKFIFWFGQGQSLWKTAHRRKALNTVIVQISFRYQHQKLIAAVRMMFLEKEKITNFNLICTTYYKEMCECVFFALSLYFTMRLLASKISLCFTGLYLKTLLVLRNKK